MFGRDEKTTDTVTVIFVPEITYQTKTVCKRLMDIVLGSVFLVMCLPLMLMISALIILMDGRPVLYVHKRVGRDGKEFGCLKFRSMVRDSEAQLRALLAKDAEARAEWKESQKLRNDPRIIPIIGSLLRSSSLDELPQLWNVVRGDMSLVGPRPVVEEELERYGVAKGVYTSVRPGLTGLWQVSGRSNDSYSDRVSKDVTYVRTWTLAGDVSIIFRTVRVVLSGSSGGAC